MVEVTIRGFTKDGEPWFVAKDATKALGYSNGPDAVAKHVDDDQKDTIAFRDGAGGPPRTIISEGGLYALIMGSKLPQAREFRRWVLDTASTTYDFSALIDGVSRTFPVRVVTLEGNPWFVAVDCCRALGLGETTVAMHTSRLSSDEKQVLTKRSTGPTHDDPAQLGINQIVTQLGAKMTAATLISESGLYKLIMRSDKPQARPFQDWVTREVLPSIRKTGAYELPKGEVMPLPVDMKRRRRCCSPPPPFS